MHHGVFHGKTAELKPKRILILGESHHVSNKSDSKDTVAGVPASYTTASVVEEYIIDPNKYNLQFFNKIVWSFGQSTKTESERREFWSRFYFGNFIDVLCGIKDDRALKQIKEHRKDYNNALFNFINEHNIDAVICFGRRVFNALPSLSDDSENVDFDNPSIYVGKTRDYIGIFSYKPNLEHKNVEVKLNKPLQVYGLRHPSARGGFKPENYVDTLKVFI